MTLVEQVVFGTETVKTVNSVASKGRRWDEAAFFEDAQGRLNAKGVVAMRRLYEFVQTTGKVAWGTGQPPVWVGAQFPDYDHASLFYLRADGELSICAVPLDRHDEARKRMYLTRKTALERAGFSLTDPGRYAECCGLPPESWMPRVAKLIQVLRKLMESH